MNERLNIRREEPDIRWQIKLKIRPVSVKLSPILREFEIASIYKWPTGLFQKGSDGKLLQLKW